MQNIFKLFVCISLIELTKVELGRGYRKKTYSPEKEFTALWCLGIALYVSYLFYSFLYKLQPFTNKI